MSDGLATKMFASDAFADDRSHGATGVDDLVFEGHQDKRHRLASMARLDIGAREKLVSNDGILGDPNPSLGEIPRTEALEALVVEETVVCSLSRGLLVDAEDDVEGPTWRRIRVAEIVGVVLAHLLDSAQLVEDWVKVSVT